MFLFFPRNFFGTQMATEKKRVVQNGRKTLIWYLRSQCLAFRSVNCVCYCCTVYQLLAYDDGLTLRKQSYFYFRSAYIFHSCLWHTLSCLFDEADGGWKFGWRFIIGYNIKMSQLWPIKQTFLIIFPKTSDKWSHLVLYEYIYQYFISATKYYQQIESKKWRNNRFSAH